MSFVWLLNLEERRFIVFEDKVMRIFVPNTRGDGNRRLENIT